MLFVYLICNV